MSGNLGIAKVKCFRFNPEIGKDPWYEDYEVPLNGKMSVLNVLDYIYENIDPTLAYPRCCFHGACGGCKVKINGKVRLACAALALDEMTIEPAGAKVVCRDLITEEWKTRGSNEH